MLPGVFAPVPLGDCCRPKFGRPALRRPNPLVSRGFRLRDPSFARGDLLFVRVGLRFGCMGQCGAGGFGQGDSGHSLVLAVQSRGCGVKTHHRIL